MLSTVGLKLLEAADHHIIEAAIKARSSRTGLPQHGKGLPSMIELVDRAGRRTLWITSGRGMYMYARQNRDDQPQESAVPLPYAVPGTLIIWHLQRLPDVPRLQ